MEDRKRNMREWYLRNKGALSDKRKEEYRTNPRIRKAFQDRARAQRARRKYGEMGGRAYLRLLNGKPTEVYSVGYVAAELETYPQMIINWELRGWIPAPLFNEHHRLYTMRQIKLLAGFYKSYLKFVESGRKREILQRATEHLDIEWGL